MTEIVNHRAPARSSPAGSRAAAALAHPRRIALASVLVLSASGWIALALMAADSGWAALCRPGAVAEWRDLVLVAPMWAAMTLAMMLPTAGPMILTYAEIAETAERKRERVVSPLLLTTGYVAVWLGFAVGAAALQVALARSGMLFGGGTGVLVSGTVFVGAGLYQFSALKHACLTLCQRPFPFFFANWTTEPAGVLRLGLRQGLTCLGCCWALMLLMFAVGVMNVVWMAALGMLMTIEKMSMTARPARALGVVLVAVGIAMIAASLLGVSGRWT